MILYPRICQGYLVYISQHHTSSTHLKTGGRAKTRTQQCKQTNTKDTVSSQMHTLACEEHLRDEDLVGNYDSRRLGKQRRFGPSREKAVLEQLRNRITRCLNRPLRDALSFPAGKADQSQLSSPWSRGEIEMWVER